MSSRLHVEHKTTDASYLLLKSFERHLRAERKDEDTVSHYCGASKKFIEFCAAAGLPDIEHATREHVEMWLELLHKRYSPHTVRNRYIGLRIFYKWLRQEDEIERDPMERMHPPSLEETQKDVVSPENMQKVFAMLEKSKRWRDAALIALLYDTGMRASEVAECTVANVNLDSGVIFIPKTKANRVRTVRLSPTGVRYLDRYLRKAKKREPEFLLNGLKGGRLTRSGIYWAVRRTFAEAGVPGMIGAHDLRHTSATHVVGHMDERDMLTLYGWTDPEMARHYAKQALTEAALKAHERSSPLERLSRKR